MSVKTLNKTTESQDSTSPNLCIRLLMEEIDDLRKPSFWKAVVAEFLGCFFLLIFAVGAGLHEEGTRGHGSVHNILASGFTIAVLISVFLTVSGAHVNPAVSIGFAVNRQISFVRFIFYSIAQAGGSVAGTALLKAITPASKIGNLGLVLPAKHVTAEQALYTEIIITFFLLFAIFALIDKDRNDVKGSIPFMVGLVVCVNIFYGSNTSGAAMNPIRAFGPAVITGNLQQHWIYWAGPLIGGAAGAFVYDKIFSVASSNSGIKSCCLGSESYEAVKTSDDPIMVPTDHNHEEKMPLASSMHDISTV
ncbi:hypothetical protein LOTGIDRAFT_185787 [Lottia gigantea]|uniref:Aquaporin n=1 Tax=Lottia gigantea TaxID=225164 RepID=V4AZ69_LOTGI|nr:hypothetical protein LOTGIDRAFT_185787 [Lottia gigantea]ESP03008.1 hypothetical protein LOTGIDRAFT_185787 [Lottia gigantea]